MLSEWMLSTGTVYQYTTAPVVWLTSVLLNKKMSDENISVIYVLVRLMSYMARQREHKTCG